MANAMKTTQVKPGNTRTPLWLRALNWLATLDQRYRDAQKLREMPRERLEDMGMTREDARNAFRREKDAASARPAGLKRPA